MGGCRPGSSEATTQREAMSKVQEGGLGVPQTLLGPGFAHIVPGRWAGQGLHASKRGGAGHEK